MSSRPEGASVLSSAPPSLSASFLKEASFHRDGFPIALNFLSRALSENTGADVAAFADKESPPLASAGAGIRLFVLSPNILLAFTAKFSLPLEAAALPPC